MTDDISLEDILSETAPEDGVLILVVPRNGLIKTFVPQLGTMTEARLEMQIPHIYRAIMTRRSQEAEKQANERITTGTETPSSSRTKQRAAAQLGKGFPSLDRHLKHDDGAGVSAAEATHSTASVANPATPTRAR